MIGLGEGYMAGEWDPRPARTSADALTPSPSG